MYKKVSFYNHFGAGDIFESRKFVKAWMDIVPAEKYTYAHGKPLNIIKDIPELGFEDVIPIMDGMRGVLDDGNGTLYVNTWIGRDSSYVLPGIGCTVEQLYRMHNDLLRVYGLGSLPGSPIDYIPEIDYSFYEVDGVNDFIVESTREKVLIDNGNVQSCQAENFEFSNIIRNVATNNPDIDFITTQLVQSDIENLHFTGYITGGHGSFFDLNEISYLSTYCSTIIGRNSGPHVFTQVKENCMDGSKKMLSFTYQHSGASFVVNTLIPLIRYWSGNTDHDRVIRDIEGVLNSGV